MLKFLKGLFNRKPKSYLLDGKFEIVPAFQWKGETYYMHRDPLTLQAGRGINSLVFMEELMMRCDVRYLKDFIEASKAIFNNSQKIDLTTLFKLHSHLEERVNFLAAVPDHVYKMASVVFFTEHESPFRYDFQEGARKIQEWKEAPGMYDFFLQTPLKILIPSLALPQQGSKEFLEVQEKINALHLTSLREALSKNGSKAGSLN